MKTSPKSDVHYRGCRFAPVPAKFISAEKEVITGWDLVVFRLYTYNHLITEPTVDMYVNEKFEINLIFLFLTNLSISATMKSN